MHLSDVDSALLRHYIYIDSDNVHEDINESAILQDIRQRHLTHYNNGEVVVYWSYNDIAELLADYDTDLHALYLNINTEYPALLADIGRCAILHKYGGVYHDLKFVTTPKMHRLISWARQHGVSVIADIPSVKGKIHRVCNTNIVAITRNNAFFDEVLKGYTDILNTAKAKAWRGPYKMYRIGSGVYFRTFRRLSHLDTSLIRRTMRWNGLVKFLPGVYEMRSRKWQKTKLPIFRDTA